MAGNVRIDELRDFRRALSRKTWPNLFDWFHFGHEAVTTARNGFNVTWRIGVVAKSSANLFDAGVQAALKIHKGFTAPDFTLDILTQNSFAGPSGQEFQNPARLRLEACLVAVAAKLARDKIHFEIAQTQAMDRRIQGFVQSISGNHK